MTNEIDWSQIHGAVKDMPERLKAVAVGDNDSLNYIFEQIEDQDNLFRLTAIVLPLLLQILNEDNKADKVRLLDGLQHISAIIDGHCSRLTNFRGTYSKLLMDLHSEFVKGAPIYVKLLGDINSSVRVRACLFVMLFVDNETARNALRTAFDKEVDNVARAFFVYMLGQMRSLENLMIDKKEMETTQMLFLNLTDDASPQVQLASALAWANYHSLGSFGFIKELPEKVFDVLLTYVITDFEDTSSDYSDHQIDLIDEYLHGLKNQPIPPSADKVTPILERLKKLSDVTQTEQRHKRAREKSALDPFKSQLPEYISHYFEPLKVFRVLRMAHPDIQMTILNSSKITPLMAHLVCLDILDKAFARKFYRFERGTPIEGQEDNMQWQNFLSYYLRDQKKPSTIMYEQPQGDYYNIDETLKLFQYRALKIVVECDKFWLLPTNLFSFFYGLPDDRETLRELAAKNKPAYIKD